MQTQQQRIRVRVIAADGCYRGGLLDLDRLKRCRSWIGIVKGGIREVLYEFQTQDDESETTRTDWFLVEHAFEPKYDSNDPEDVIDEASVARRMTPEDVERWFADRPFPPPPTLAATLRPPRPAFNYSSLQLKILEALKGCALKKKSLLKAVELSQASDLYRKVKGGGLNGLKARGEVEHKAGLGYFRPDCPPRSA